MTHSHTIPYYNTAWHYNPQLVVYCSQRPWLNSWFCWPFYPLLWSLLKDNMPCRPSAIHLHHTVSYHTSYHNSLHSYYTPHYIPYYIVKEFYFVHTNQSIAVTHNRNAKLQELQTSHHFTSTFLLVDNHIETSSYEFTWIYINIYEFTWPT